MAPEDVLKPGVLSRREHPPGGLQLMDLTQASDPGVIDDLTLRHLVTGHPCRERDVPVNRIVAQVLVPAAGHMGDYVPARAGS